MAQVQIPVALGGTNTIYRDDTGANGMASANGFGYNTLFFAMSGEMMTAFNTVYSFLSGAGAVNLWVNGTNYAQGVVVWSPANFQNYRKKTPASVSVTDPSADAANWEQLTVNNGGGMFFSNGWTATFSAPTGAFAASRILTQMETNTAARTYVCGPTAGAYGTWEVHVATSTGAPVMAWKVAPSGHFLLQTTTDHGDLTIKQSVQGVAAVLVRNPADGSTLFSVAEDAGGTAAATPNGGATVLRVYANNATSRSINASGTVNASGADYAEYMHKDASCGTVAKGALVGVTTSGLLTDRFADAITVAVKSTNPSYVGGDTWGTDEALGLPRPVRPTMGELPYTGREKPEEPSVTTEGIAPADPTDPAAVAEFEAAVEERHAAAMQRYREELADYEADVAAWNVAYETAREEFEAGELASYHAEVQAYEAALETARQKVDRIAFAGQVPVNVYGATPGQHIVPVDDGAGGIAGVAMNEADMTLSQYMRSVGKVIAIEPDGRARIIVKVA